MSTFEGRIGRTVAESQPWWPQPPHRDRAAPNIVTIVFDDTGWSDFGCFGSEIDTPAIDALAGEGLRFNNFHVTPLCSPTRAAMMTGRNHHDVGMRSLADNDTGFPNGRGAIRADIPTLPQMLRQGGYGTYMVGKWHLAPHHEQTPAGPYHNWPLARGFDRFYGFLGGCTDQYTPELVQDNHHVDPPLHEGYHLSEDLCDRAITYLRDHQTFRETTPFYLHIAFGATHAPIQVPERFVMRNDARFAKGWDAIRADRLARQKAQGLVPDTTDLVPRDGEVPAWDDLSADEQRLFTRMQAAYAGFLEHTDEQIARLVAELRKLELFDNTIILIMSDNGASREGGPRGAVNCNAPYSGTPESIAEMIPRIDDIGGRNGPAHYPMGWAMAGNTPFRKYKQFVELGGTRSPLVVSWPRGITGHGEVRNQFLHVIDLAPTLLGLAGCDHAASFDGKSFRDCLTSSTAPAPRSVQYWETFGRRAIWRAGWKASSEHEKGDDYAADRWHLYDTTRDFSEAHDLATQHPDILDELKDLWWREAEENDVLPLDDRTLVDLINFRAPSGLVSRREITLRPGQGHVSQPSLVTSTDRSMEIRCHLAGPWQHESGVLVSSGDDLGGYSLYVQGGCLELVAIRQGVAHHLSAPLPAGAETLSLLWQTDPQDMAVATLLADGARLGQAAMGRTSRHASFWGLDVGRDAARPVTDRYQAPFPYPPERLDRVVLRFLENMPAEDIAGLMESTE